MFSPTVRAPLTAWPGASRVSSSSNWAMSASAPEIDGWTGDQRFFLGWAQVWRGAARQAEAERLLALDPHAPMDLRANAVRNLSEFHEAFGVAPGDGLWVAPEDRVRIF